MKLKIQKNIIINRPSSEVFKVISDISKWNIWSPWLQCEPTTQTESKGVAGQIDQVQTWNGDVIGSGKMSIYKVEKNNLVKMKIEFLKPWKSVADVEFEIKTIANNQTQVFWNMDSNLPFFMFFFKKMLSAYMGNDFIRGLRLLKEYLETGAVISHSIYQGEKEFPAFQVIGKKTTCNISEIANFVQPDFDLLNQLVQKNEIPKPEGLVCLNHKFDIPNEICEITAGYSYNINQKLKIPPGLENTLIPPHKALLVDYYGPYRNISNGWAMASSYFRSKKMKVAKNIPMYEHYMNSPHGIAEKEIHTQIIMPKK